ncbi:hypothetical protein LZ32DRAFT_197659 [Colletotrichum eremochloae]|nr:hypothetical protein LZ32DRAFT_197659 [Colletotrichum eremochloae]
MQRRSWILRVPLQFRPGYEWSRAESSCRGPGDQIRSHQSYIDWSPFSVRAGMPTGGTICFAVLANRESHKLGSSAERSGISTKLFC